MRRGAYLLDEHMPRRFRRELVRRQPDLTVWFVGDLDAPPLGSPDADILRWCERNGFMLVTNNRHSMPGHLAEHLTGGGHVPGIFVLRANAAIGRVLDDLILIAEASFENEYRDRIEFIPL